MTKHTQETTEQINKLFYKILQIYKILASWFGDMHQQLCLYTQRKAVSLQDKFINLKDFKYVLYRLHSESKPSYYRGFKFYVIKITDLLTGFQNIKTTITFEKSSFIVMLVHKIYNFWWYYKTEILTKFSFIKSTYFEWIIATLSPNYNILKFALKKLF